SSLCLRLHANVYQGNPKHQSVYLHLFKAGIAQTSGDVRLSLELVDRFWQVVIRSAIAGDQSSHKRRECMEVPVEDLAKPPELRPVEFQEDNAATARKHASHLPEGTC